MMRDLHLPGRSAVYARNGICATSHPLAAQVAVEMLKSGGNAVDAALAGALVLGIAEPQMTGIGGDCFVLLKPAGSNEIHALNGSGRAPAALDFEAVQRAGLFTASDQPMAKPYHALTITVPGAVAGWCDLLARFGALPLRDVLASAIHHAEVGFPVAPLTALAWARGAERQLRHARGGQALLIGDRAPRAGEVFRNPGYARALRAIADGGAPAYYTGAIAKAVAATVQAAGGVLTEDDLAAHRSTWETPLSVTYRGQHIWECPPNGQGLTALLALNLLEGFDLKGLDPLGTERWHLLIEAMRLAWADARRWVADPAFGALPLEELLTPAYLASRRSQIDRQRANLAPAAGLPAAERWPVQPAPRSDTVYLSVVDGQGNACSFINSLYHGFGSGLVAPGTGVALQNRGALFSLDPDHPNRLAPGKRPYHTIIPALATQDDELWASFGVMGGFMQPQGHLQVLVNLLNLGLTPQEALDAPRFCLLEGEAGGRVAIEAGAGDALIAALRAQGHDLAVTAGLERTLFGVGQVIRRTADRVLIAGSDPRRDGCAVGW